MSKLLDDKADVLPYGLQVTPFGDVWKALQAVAASTWSVDPTVYRSGIAWGWYALHNPAVLESQRELVIAALISEQAPLIKADQTDAELVEYLRQWRDFRPTYDRLEALYKLFAADVEILPISTPGAPAVEDSRLAYYVRIYGVDFDRLLTLDEARTIALRVSPLGSRPIVYYDLEENVPLPVNPLYAGISSQNWENDAICEPAIVAYTLSFVNTQLPDITITMPQTETVPAGSSVTLPTMSGEYESDGVTWTPNAWDIGAFGSSYTVNDNTVAHLLFNALPEYNFIVLNNTTGAPVYRLSMDDMIIAIESSDDLEYFYFTANGANETHDTLIDDDDDSNITLFDADGNPVGQMQREVYDNKPALYFEQYSGNMFAAVNDDLLSDHQGNLTLIPGSGTGERKAWSLQAKKIVNVDIDVIYGDPVKIPYGYKIESVKGTRLYLNLPNVASGSGHYLNFNYKGENTFCNLNDSSVLGFGTSPTLQIFIIANLDNGNGWYVTYRSSYTGQYHGTQADVKKINTGGYFVNLWRVYYTDPTTESVLAAALNNGNGYPVSFEFYDSNDKWVRYFFNVQHFLWQYQFGEFSWLGDTETKTTMAYWYNYYHVEMRIHCVPNDGIDIDVHYGDTVTIPAGYEVATVKSHVAYVFAQNASNQSGSFLFDVPGKGYYFDDTDTDLIVLGGYPCLQLWQAVSKNADTGAYSGYWLSTTKVQSVSSATPKPENASCVLNGQYNSTPVMMHYKGKSGTANVNTTLITAINKRANSNGAFILQMRMYDVTLSQEQFFFNVPKDVWRFKNGVFSWPGDTTSANAEYELPFWYSHYGVIMRIHCVPSPGPQLYNVAWFSSSKNNVSVSYMNSPFTLYDDSGNTITYDSSKSYTLLWFEDKDGVEQSTGGVFYKRYCSLSSNSNGKLICVVSSGQGIASIAKVYYTVTG